MGTEIRVVLVDGAKGAVVVAEVAAAAVADEVRNGAAHGAVPVIAKFDFESEVQFPC